MILIFSEEKDLSTNDVIEWIIASNKEFVRINSENIGRVVFHHYDSLKQEILVTLDGQPFNLCKIESVWYRRGGFSPSIFKDTRPGKGISIFKKKFFLRGDRDNYVIRHFSNERETIFGFLQQKVENSASFSLSKKSKTVVNKLEVMEIAKKHGLSVPNTIITGEKKKLKEVITKDGAVITKAVSDGIYYFSNRHAYYTYTEKITKRDIKVLPDNFFPSLIQNEVVKKFELRIFYLNGKFYPMVIFSQRNPRTLVDSRKIDLSSPNRSVPFKLPTHIKLKLSKVLRELDLNTGSVDMLVSTTNDYIFLEVNPIGQFGMVSRPCNYPIEQHISALL